MRLNIKYKKLVLPEKHALDIGNLGIIFSRRTENKSTRVEMADISTICLSLF
jgi:hypothetical protein